jgi:phosphatidyl-myo-inositol dimannoside synthase
VSIILFISGFSSAQIKLQPWLTLYRVGEVLSNDGREVHIVTDIPNQHSIGRISVHSVNSLRGTNSTEILEVLARLAPTIVVASVTPVSLITSKWYVGLSACRSFAYISYPFYTFAETWRALPYLSRADKIAYGRHVLVPNVCWRSRLVNVFQGVVCQSARTGQRLAALTDRNIPTHIIPPGIDIEDWANTNGPTKRAETTTFLFIGAPSTIRGFSLLLVALEKVKDDKIRLRVLARGREPDEVADLERQINTHRLQNYVSVKGGWLGRDELKNEISAASAVVMPFALVPSELPVSVLESIYCGTPVIVSDIDGLPDAVGEAGIVVDQCSVVDLARAMDRIHRETGLVEKLKEACSKRKSSIRGWDDVARDWMKVMGI